MSFDSADSISQRTSPLAKPLKLPCGAVLPNRIAKAAMTEGLADDQLYATHRHETLYRRWSGGGAGLLITGNVMIVGLVAGKSCPFPARGGAGDSRRRGPEFSVALKLNSDDFRKGASTRPFATKITSSLPRGDFFSPASPLMPVKIINVLGGQAWYYQQIFRLADGEKADLDLGILKAVGAFVKDELSRSRREKKARRQPVV